MNLGPTDYFTPFNKGLHGAERASASFERLLIATG
jgi:hypothetical protein